MLKNKIYKYLSAEIFKNFITILLTFTIIAWTVRSVNFLDLMIQDGYSASIYFKYSLLNIFTIITRFVPLAFLLAIIMSISKFERQQELLILWSVGVNKIKIINVLLLIGFFIAFLQIVLSVFVNPYALNESRSLLRETESKQINSMLKSGDFSDNFKGVTFYIDEKNANDELVNIFIRDTNGNFNSIIKENQNAKNTTIFSEKGIVSNNKLILFNGTIQTLTKKNVVNDINFEKTELSLVNLSTRTILQPKIQETSTKKLLSCFMPKILGDCMFKNNKKIVIETLSRRVGMPLYIPLISIMVSFLLLYKREKKYNFLKKYIIFSFAFIVLIFAEILLKYSGFSMRNFSLYFFSPIILMLILYSILIKKMIVEKI
jgi:lipopolysaccharide export system permease protein